jgi:hypothetical protein
MTGDGEVPEEQMKWNFLHKEILSILDWDLSREPVNCSLQ